MKWRAILVIVVLSAVTRSCLTALSIGIRSVGLGGTGEMIHPIASPPSMLILSGGWSLL